MLKMEMFKVVGIIVCIAHAAVTSNDHSYKEPSSTKSCDGGVNKLKITDAKLLLFDEKRTDRESFNVKVVPVNETYNNLSVEFEMIRDLPEDTQLEVRVMRSALKNGHYKEVARFTSYVCDDNDKYHDYLPNLVIKHVANGNCLRKGRYTAPDFGMFKFYNILPEKEIAGYYFEARHDLKSSDGTFYSIDIASQSVCAK